MDIERHRRKCTVCACEEKAEIEAAYVAYKPVDEIARMFSVDRTAIYRHVAAYPVLKEKRFDNILGACDWIIGHGMRNLDNGGMEPTPALLSAAMGLGAKIRGQLIDRTADVTVQLEKATEPELAFFAKTGRLPGKDDKVQ